MSARAPVTHLSSGGGKDAPAGSLGVVSPAIDGLIFFVPKHLILCLSLLTSLFNCSFFSVDSACYPFH